jgi:3-dehydroquinate synthase
LTPEVWKSIESIYDAHEERIVKAGRIENVVGGESVKNDVHLLERMLKVMNEAELDRRSYVVVIGGGAVLDAVGFAAGLCHRGVRLVRLPTTTLAQADSGVGVKSGVNLFGKKNWIGTFGVPWGVINDARLLSTLPTRDFRCGFAEAVKVALLKRPSLFAEIESASDAIAAADVLATRSILKASALLHLEHITRGGDPFEAEEARPLDFGHWSAHKLESASNFRIRHGEAVAIGLAIDTIYSSMVHGLPGEDAARVVRLLHRLGFRFDAPELSDVDILLDGLEEFRQHLGGRLTLTMLAGIGQPIDVHDVRRQQLCRAINELRDIESIAANRKSF